MNYTKEQCLFFLKNAELLEKSDEVVEVVQVALFKAINARIEKRIKGLGGWKGTYTLVSGPATKNDETETAFSDVGIRGKKGGQEGEEKRHKKNDCHF